MTLKWNDKEFKTDLISTLVANGEIVGRFLEADARKRLLAVQSPDWGAGHRRYVARLITNEVEQERNAVVIRLGLPPGKKTKSGASTRHLGFYIELGSRTAPAHPFLRPAVFQNGAKIVALLSGK
jgi:hypothetical protein